MINIIKNNALNKSIIPLIYEILFNYFNEHRNNCQLY